MSLSSQKGRSGVETFVVATLKHHGGRVAQLRRHALRATFETVSPFASEPAFVVAFDRKSAEVYPGALLADAGSALYTRMLEFAREGGNVATAYTPLVEPLPETPSPRLVTGRGLSWATSGPITDHPVLVYNFAISYQSVVTSDDLISIAYDPVLGRFRDPGVIDALHSVWSEMLPSPPDVRAQHDVPDLGAALPSVLESLDRRIHRKVARARRNTQRYLEREIQGVEDYYRQLIAEEREVLNRLSRTSPKEAEEREKRIKRFQLDWKRRIAEEQRHHQCRVHIRLVNAATVLLPRTAILLTGDDLPAPLPMFFNHFLGSLDGPTCSKTGREVGPWLVNEGGQWISRLEGPACDEDGETDFVPPGS